MRRVNLIFHRETRSAPPGTRRTIEFIFSSDQPVSSRSGGPKESDVGFVASKHFRSIISHRSKEDFRRREFTMMVTLIEAVLQPRRKLL